jgi:hypothetical protein
MTFFLRSVLVALAHALIIHSCAEGIRMILGYLVPGISPPVRIVLGLTLAITLVEAGFILWKQRTS